MRINLAEQVLESKCGFPEAAGDFIAGDVVVFASRIAMDGLQTVKAQQASHYYRLEGGQIVHEQDIRPATLAELKAKRRLAEPVALFVTEAP
ncbi:hypothetical protein [Acinetobacter radioresistens]|uniref:hypothetical protein n=1 Tax=Acinetobacter radioresistens TaxID=40216 RepID=UPI000E74A47E|nr:hypothetical protein [Acinetobacter radioresistens]RJL73054.1 hypothetical protein D5055_06595 [Acinetobacter radioresistens]